MAHEYPDDETLLKSIQNDDMKAFRHLYERYWNDMLSAAYAKTGSQEVAEEIVQEIFVSIWEKRRERQIEKVRPYLFSALKYAVISHLRKTIAQRSDHNQTHFTATSSENEAPLSVEDLEQTLARALDTLPEKTRTVFVMSRFEEKSHREIAAAFNMSEKAVEYHITSALKSLRVYLRAFL